MSAQVPEGYTHSPTEAFMNPVQVAYFRRKLLKLRADTQHELDAISAANANEDDREGDEADKASASEDREFGLINKDRAHALLSRIEQALTRIDNGTYGYCADTGQPITLARLEAQPTATLTTDAQAAREQGGR
jgi:DnaK suppressor protein